MRVRGGLEGNENVQEQLRSALVASIAIDRSAGEEWYQIPASLMYGFGFAVSENKFRCISCAPVPSSSPQTLDMSDWSCVHAMAEYVSRGLPLLLLDTRNRNVPLANGSSGEGANQNKDVINPLSSGRARGGASGGRAMGFEMTALGTVAKTAAACTSVDGLMDYVRSEIAVLQQQLEKAQRTDTYLASTMAFLHLSKTDFFDAMLSTDRQQGTLSAAIEDLVKEHAKEGKQINGDGEAERDDLMVNGSRHEQESAACKEMARCLAQVDDTKIAQMVIRSRIELDDCSQRLHDAAEPPHAVSGSINHTGWGQRPSSNLAFV
jgi:hypothetical protein